MHHDETSSASERVRMGDFWPARRRRGWATHYSCQAIRDDSAAIDAACRRSSGFSRRRLYGTETRTELHGKAIPFGAKAATRDLLIDCQGSGRAFTSTLRDGCAVGMSTSERVHQSHSEVTVAPALLLRLTRRDNCTICKHSLLRRRVCTASISSPTLTNCYYQREHGRRISATAAASIARPRPDIDQLHYQRETAPESPATRRRLCSSLTRN